MPGPAAVLADDLTGACDVGVGALAAGRSVRCIFFRGGRIPAGAGVTVLDMETRRLGESAAVRRAACAGRRLRRAGRRPRYFKIDSTLRGHPVAEAEAVRLAAGMDLVWLVPANPAMGRTTVGGRQFVHGVPLERTTYARDPLNPVPTGDVVALASRVLGRRSCARLGLADLARGKERVARLRAAWERTGVRVVVADVRSDADLGRLSGCVRDGDFVAGAAALAGRLLGWSRGKPGPRRPAFRRGRGLAVIGSLNPLTAEQVRRAGRVRGVCVRFLGPAELASGRVALPGRAARWLVLALSRDCFRRALAARRIRGEGVARALASLAARTARRWRPSGLMLSGGLTAASVCEAMGIPELRLRGEAAPGLVASDARAGRHGLRIVTKPGGFGSAGALAAVLAGGCP